LLNGHIQNNLAVTLPLGTYAAPLAASGQTLLSSSIPKVGGLTFGWQFYKDAAGTVEAEPGDDIIKAVLTLSGTSLSSNLNKDIAELEYSLGRVPYGIIDGSGVATFSIEAEPLGPAPIPEPGTMLLTGLGLLGLGAWGAKRRKK